jgi:hypothetical protein
VRSLGHTRHEHHGDRNLQRYASMGSDRRHCGGVAVGKAATSGLLNTSSLPVFMSFQVTELIRSTITKSPYENGALRGRPHHRYC